MGKQGRLSFGEDFAESGTQEKHHFTTYERDTETGLDYAVNRMYSPGVGRFMQRDPYKGGCDSNNPQKLSRYSYVENDPMNKVDPLGLMSWSGFLCVIAPILCEVNSLPGGGPPPNPDGYTGWGFGFGGGGETSIRTAHTTYQFIGQECFGRDCVRHYELFCVFLSRAFCGGTEFTIITNGGPAHCRRYVRETSLYWRAFKTDGCQPITWRFTDRPELCD